MNKEQALISDLRKKGYFRYRISPQLAEDTEELMEYWKAFHAQSMEEKMVHIFNERWGGYEYKDEKQKDYKENFHITLDYKIPPESTTTSYAFIKAAQSFILKSVEAVRPMLDIMSESWGVNLTSEALKCIQRWQLRCLYYPPREDKQRKLAVGHIDKSLTTHWIEDAPGLQILWNGEWHDIFSKHGEIHGYGGMSAQLYAGPEFPALTHRVIPNQKSLSEGRNSIVMFHDFGEYIFNKALYGSTQGIFGSGENYGMPDEEFRTYFIPFSEELFA